MFHKMLMVVKVLELLLIFYFNSIYTNRKCGTNYFMVVLHRMPTIEDINVNGSNIVWYPTPGDAAAGTNAIPAGTQLVDGAVYYAGIRCRNM